jgi:hypothetical protein
MKKSTLFLAKCRVFRPKCRRRRRRSFIAYKHKLAFICIVTRDEHFPMANQK